MMIGRIEYGFCKARHKRVYLSCMKYVTAYFFWHKSWIVYKIQCKHKANQKGVVRFGLYLFLWGFRSARYKLLTTNFL